MLAKIHVTLKNGVLDSQGNLGKYMEIALKGVSEQEAQSRVTEMCEKLLANTVIESYRFTLEPAE
jgi:phosphoribosylformylglycinamidine synthase